MFEKPLKTVEVGITPYLNIVDMRNSYIRIRSIDHPETYIDVYKGTLGRLAAALRQIEVEDLRSGQDPRPSSEPS
jgi:hypothetical protein